MEQETNNTEINEQEKKIKTNKLTIKANLNFNVNQFKKWIKNKLVTDENFFEYEGKLVPPKLSGAHIALTAMNEKLCFMILEKTIERTIKDKNGLYTINFQDMTDIINVNPELRQNFKGYLEIFDNTLNYKDQYCINEKCVKSYIDKMFSVGIDISNEAFNLLIYLLLKTCVRIIDTSYIMTKHAKKRTFNYKVIMSSVEIHFTKSFAHLLNMRIEEAIKLCWNDLKDKEEKQKKEDIQEKEEEPESKEAQEKEETVVEEKNAGEGTKTKPKKKN